MYEVYGLPGGGRTQLVLHLAAKNALQGYNSLYIDTKNDFCIDRFSEIISGTLDSTNPNKAKKIKLNCDQNDELLESYVNKVKIAKVFNIESLLKKVTICVYNKIKFNLGEIWGVQTKTGSIPFGETGSDNWKN